MNRVERGLKRRCASCDAPFYDMLRQPIQCPKCGAVYDAVAGKRLSSVPRPPKVSRVPFSRPAAKAAPVAALGAPPAPHGAEMEDDELDAEEQVDRGDADDEDEEDADENADEEDTEAIESR